MKYAKGIDEVWLKYENYNCKQWKEFVFTPKMFR